MHSKTDNIEIIINHKANEVTAELFKSLIKKYQIGLEKSLKGSDFTLDCVHSWYCKCRKINFKWGGSYIVFPDWAKTKKEQ